MHSILSDHFPSAEALQAALQNWCRDYPYAAAVRGTSCEIRLPDRPPLAWHAPKRRISIKRRRTIFGYEQAATAAFDFVCAHAAVDAVYDLGAENGYFGFLGAARQSDPIETHCFEMRPSAIQALEDMARTYKLDHLHPHLSGMSDRHHGTQRIWFSITKMFEEKPDEHSYRDPWYTQLKFWLKGRRDRDRLWRADVRIDSIDAFTARHGLAPGLIKIDVDGYEAKALPGGTDTFRKARPVIFLELHKSRFFSHHGVTRAEIVQPLFSMGYSCFLFSNHHNLKRNRIKRLTANSPELSREQTDFMIFT